MVKHFQSVISEEFYLNVEGFKEQNFRLEIAKDVLFI